eukprot:1338032-Amorphochlora_amoeboformis.AAC.1
MLNNIDQSLSDIIDHTKNHNEESIFNEPQPFKHTIHMFAFLQYSRRSPGDIRCHISDKIARTS